MFVDSDDMIVPEVYKEMLEIAFAQNADIVRCNYVRTKWGSTMQSLLNNRSNIGMEKAINDLKDTPNLVYDTPCWNKLIRRSLLLEKNIFFPEGVVLNEDAPFMLKLFYYSNKCITVFRTGYLWRIRTDDEQPSSTQMFNTDAAFYGKLNTMLECIEFCKENDVDETVINKLVWKSVVTEILQFTENLNSLSKRDAEKRIKCIADFIGRVGEVYDLSYLSPEVTQIITTLKELDIDRIVRLSAFTRRGIGDCPIIYNGDSIHIRLPEELFENQEAEATNAFVDIIPQIIVCKATVSNDKLIFHGHIFINRLQTNDEYPLNLSAFAINSRNNSVIKLNAETCESYYLTRDYGSFVCPWDYQTYDYNYDKGGFRIFVDLKEIEAADKMFGDISIHIKYENTVCSGTSLIKGASVDVAKFLKKWKHTSGECRITSFIDRSGSIFLKKTITKKVNNRGLKRLLKRKYSLPIGKKHSITFKIK